MTYIPDRIRNQHPPDSLPAAADRMNANFAAIAAELEFMSPFLPQFQAQYEWLALEPGSQTVLRLPPEILDIGGHRYRLGEALLLDVNLAANWDDPSLAVQENRRGKDLRVYAAWPGSGGLAPDYILSANATFPTGKDATNSRARGGFHGLCASVGTISGHPFSGLMRGDVHPNSIWCPIHRPAVALPNGLFYNRYNDLWETIYPLSGTGTSTVSAWNAVISDSRTWEQVSADLNAVYLRFFTDHEFFAHANGSNIQTNIYGSQDPVKTGKIGVPKFTGSGLNDLSLDRANWWHTNENQEYEVRIAATGTPDTIQHRKRNFGGTWSDWTTGVPVVAGAITIADGLTVAFGATTGHTTGDVWTLYIMEAGIDTNIRRMISSVGAEMPCGAMCSWLSDQLYRYDNDMAWRWISGSYGDLNIQGPSGYVKLVAGGDWNDGSHCGHRARIADRPHWQPSPGVGARGCARPLQLAA